MKKSLILALVAVTLSLTSLSAKGKQVEGIVNLNTATVEQLMLLPGVGASKAKAIITYREAHPFKSADELQEVKGLGPKIVGKLQRYLAVQGPTTIHEVSAATPTASR